MGRGPGAGPTPAPPPAPTPRQGTASSQGCTRQHPGVHPPARRCCRATAPQGHPARYVPIGGLSPARVPREGWWRLNCHQSPCSVGRDSTGGGSGSFVQSSVSPRASVSPAWLLAHVRCGRAALCCRGHSPLEPLVAPTATGSPGDLVLGTGTRWCTGAEGDSMQPGAGGLPGDMALSAHRRRWGSVTTLRTPRPSLFNPVSP